MTHPTPVNKPAGRLIECGTSVALDGSRVTHFRGAGEVVYQRFTAQDGHEWWQGPERLCGLRDIDTARKAVKA
jgi:hypothetical protein